MFRELLIEWTLFFLLAIFIYMLISSTMMYFVSKSITQPILELTEKIKMNIARIQLLKRHSGKDAQGKTVNI